MDEVIKIEKGKAIYNGYVYSRVRSAYNRLAKDRGTHTYQEWYNLCKEYDFRCCKCGCEVIGGMPTKDHIIGVRYGGSDSIENLQPLCRGCNLEKGGITIDYRRKSK